ncbi:MAG: TonB-dependent receptor [Bergeyella sp.]|nr:TonB-dependent receptor [Bergeyella sp.]
MKRIYFFLGIFPLFLSAQKNKRDSLSVVTIKSVDFIRRLPTTKEVISVKKILSSKNVGQDLPILLKNQIAVVSTSDAGNGVGYTGLRIRGLSGNSINVMLNGVPYNDSESQGTFFVNVPDLTSSASQIVIQRGVGTSSNGVSAFGASVNVISRNPEDKFYIQSDNSVGSFNTYKYAVEIGSGRILGNRVSFMARYSRIYSDGYVDRAFSNLHSYQFTGLYGHKKTKIRFLFFGGKEKTYQAWNGIDRITWKKNPRFNYSGAIYDSGQQNIIGFYKNETDNYAQKNTQVLWTQEFSSLWKLETTLHYTRGFGYYENYKQNQKLSKYNLSPVLQNGVLVRQSDFIREKWLDNNFYGIVSTLYGKAGSFDLNFGFVANQYYGRHFGNVTGVSLQKISNYEYYRNRSVKNEISSYVKAIYKLSSFEFFGDLQLRNIDYDGKILVSGDNEGADFSKKWGFFNPKAGVTYRSSFGKLYFTYGYSQREPNRADLIANPDVQEERLHDYELGFEKKIRSFQFAADVYYMSFTNQLVMTGEIDNVGAFIRRNSGKSYRAGMELSTLVRFTKEWKLTGNFSLSINRNRNYKSENSGVVKAYGDTSLSFSPNFIGNLLVTYCPEEKLRISLQSKYVSSQYLDNTENDSLKLSGYFLTDFIASYSRPIFRKNAEFKLLINNIFNKKYTNNGYVYGTYPYFYSQAGTNFLFGINFRI